MDRPPLKPARLGLCSDLTYAGQPNAIAGVGASGGDIDVAWGSSPGPGGNFPLYVASLNLASVSVATSTDNGRSFINVPVQAGVPIDDREWIAAYGATTSLLTFHDVATGDIDVLRSDFTGLGFVQIAQAIPLTDYRASHNQIGNIVIDHGPRLGTSPGPVGLPGFWAYQSLVAPSSDPGPLGGTNNEAFVSVSNDGGFHWTTKPIPCSTTSIGGSLDHQFPNVSVAPNGNLWAAWSDDKNVYTAGSSDHGDSWTCTPPVSTNTAQAVMPWLVATSAGVDLAYYGSPTAPGAAQTFYVYFAQNPTSATTATAWGSPQQLTPVHQGPICESGVLCTTGRQLFDDLGIDTDQNGWAHIAYSHDSPALGGPSTYTGYLPQIGGTPAGKPN